MLAELRTRAAEFESVFRRVWNQSPDRTVTHPYFNNLSLGEALTMSIVHTRHHFAVLPAARGQISSGRV
jgi:hypothetical protein